jgi:hypothetical protein
LAGEATPRRHRCGSRCFGCFHAFPKRQHHNCLEAGGLAVPNRAILSCPFRSRPGSRLLGNSLHAAALAAAEFHSGDLFHRPVFCRWPLGGLAFADPLVYFRPGPGFLGLSDPQSGGAHRDACVAELGRLYRIYLDSSIP